MTFSTYQKFFLSHLMVLLLFMLISGSYFYYSAQDSIMDSLRSRLSHSAALLSRTFNIQELDTFRNKEALATTTYQTNIQKIRSFSDTDQDIAFIYIMRREKNHAVFVLDSDPEQAAVPGEKYDAVLPELMAGFAQLSADREINQDKWGSFLSGYAPVYGSQGQYLVGIDMRADDVVNKLERLEKMAIFSLLACFVLAILFSMLLARHYIRRLKVLTQQCDDVFKREDEVLSIQPKGDELDTLSYAFQNMTQQVQVRQQLDETAKLSLQKARDALKSIVKNRTEELQKVNQKLLLEIEERKKVENELERSAYSDYLTGLLNRRAMMRILEHEGKRTCREKESFCLIFIDIDHFKQVNDEYGHDIGDKVLIALTKKLSRLMRSNDVLARWGGEEFLLLSANTKMADAMLIAETLRYALATHVFVFDQIELHITASFGISQHTDASSLDDSIRMADAAMYDAKHQGRNCIISFIEHRNKENINNTDLHRRKPA